ncbi:winged helix DNA-binding domain-containing protein [Streptosporangium sp. NBC_01756]|uniref:winged helix DNA-binding domain-containing protein n=1 Tax=Streptosporangium sp. NBC_01756 TaxID=2975950 RepID=UPI002DDBC802|nr:winged helix DNA-binding domain-containing protein [Streptosporangium sp. NBC_01756]WSC88522.1 winged helix DNA-binding domain-containing protein [Streptosporangium sp. NBC_01756]
MTGTPALSQRVLNRTLLERQLLTRRTSRSVLDVIGHLVAMQAQEPNWPYIGLWTRLDGFRHADLTELLQDRSVVRATMVRRTQHLTGAEDFRWLRPTIQPLLDRGARVSYYARETAGLDLAELAEVGRELLADRTLPRRQFSRMLAERYPGRDGRVLGAAVELQVPLAHGPQAGVWGGWGTRSGIPVTVAETWIGRPLTEARVDTLIHRYLAAFGPATVMDVQAWSGLTRLREVVDGMRSRLRVLRDGQGRELFDLPDASLAEADAPVPVRFMPAYDNLLLGHADRTRVISDEDRKRVMPGGALVLPTFLVDGLVHGIWSVQGSTLHISPFRPLSRADREAVLEEAGRLLAFVAPDAAQRDIVFS